MLHLDLVVEPEALLILDGIVMRTSFQIQGRVFWSYAVKRSSK